jgi:hypothetical protein
MSEGGKELSYGVLVVSFLFVLAGVRIGKNPKELRKRLKDDQEYQNAKKQGNHRLARKRKQILYFTVKHQKIYEKNKAAREVREAERKAAEEVREAERIEKLRNSGRRCRDCGRPFCTWCGGPESSLQFLGGKEGTYFWKYRNKDGSRDKRSKDDNYQMASYQSEWECRECGAKSKARHFVHKFPSEDVDISSIWLIENGSGLRWATDWDSPDATTIDVNKAHRKGDD